MINRGHLRHSRHKMQTTPRRGYVCKFCGSGGHYSFTCFKRPKKLKLESTQHRNKRMATRKAWFAANKPDLNGQWPCYLRIAPICPKMVTITTIDLEHVRPKGGHPKLRYKIENIKAACQPCNKLKRSWELSVLAETYPQIAALISTEEWATYEKQLDELEAS